MIPVEIRDKINNGEMNANELRIMVYGFAESISKTGNRLFKIKEEKDD